MPGSMAWAVSISTGCGRSGRRPTPTIETRHSTSGRPASGCCPTRPSDAICFGNVGAMAQDRRARVAVAALFLTNGAIFANLLPRYPEIKADLHLSNAVFGAAIAAFSAGALVAGLAA